MSHGKIGLKGAGIRGGAHKAPRGVSRKVACVVAAAMACGCMAGLSGCSLFTPTRAEVPPKEKRVRVMPPAIMNKGVLAVALDDANAPLAMDNAQGKLTGYLTDVAYALGQRLGVTVEFVTDETPSDMASSSEADLYVGASGDINVDGVSVFGAVLQDAPALFTKGSVDAPVDASDLAGATVGVQSSSAAQDILTVCGIEADQKTFSNANELFEALDAGEVDYVACDSAIGGYLSRAYADIAFAGTLDEPQKFGIALRASNSELEDEVAEALDELQADGTLDAVYRCWFGRLPVDLSDALLGGITTSAQRKQEEEERREQEEAQGEDGTQSEDGTQGEDGAQDGNGTQGAGESRGDASQSSSTDDTTER